MAAPSVGVTQRVPLCVPPAPSDRGHPLMGLKTGVNRPRAARMTPTDDHDNRDDPAPRSRAVAAAGTPAVPRCIPRQPDRGPRRRRGCDLRVRPASTRARSCPASGRRRRRPSVASTGRGRTSRGSPTPTRRSARGRVVISNVGRHASRSTTRPSAAGRTSSRCSTLRWLPAGTASHPRERALEARLAMKGTVVQPTVVFDRPPSTTGTSPRSPLRHGRRERVDRADRRRASSPDPHATADSSTRARS